MTQTRHRRHLVSRAEFARRSSRSRSSITGACAGPLADACAGNGKRIDAAHPAAVAWARERGIDPAALLDSAKQGQTNALGGSLFSVEVGGELILGASIDEVVETARDHHQLRLIPMVDGEHVEFLDIDHPAHVEFLAEQWGRPCTKADLDRIWTESQAEPGGEAA